MLTSDFEVDGILVRIKRANPELDAFDAAIYTRKLYQIYGDIQADLRTAEKAVRGEDEESAIAKLQVMVNPAMQAALLIFSKIKSFSKIAPRVVEMHGEVAWAGARSSAELIDETFRFWLGNASLQARIKEECATLDNPNGVLAGKLTEAQKKDPLSESSGGSIATN